MKHTHKSAYTPSKRKRKMRKITGKKNRNVYKSLRSFVVVVGVAHSLFVMVVVVMLHLFFSPFLTDFSWFCCFFSHFFFIVLFSHSNFRSIPYDREGKKRNDALKKSRILNRRISTLKSLMLRSKLKKLTKSNNKEHAKCIRSRSFSVSLCCAQVSTYTEFLVLFFSLCLILFISLASATSCTADILSRWSQSS